MATPTETRRFALTPTLTATEVTALKRWLRDVLASPTLDNRERSYPLGQGKLAIFMDGTARQLVTGAWQTAGQEYLYVGGASTRLQVAEKLAIVASIISLTNLWGEFTDEYGTAMSRVLLEAYNTSMQGLVQTQGAPATKLAFNTPAQSVAAFIGDDWYLPNGTVAVVEGTDWVVAE